MTKFIYEVLHATSMGRFTMMEVRHVPTGIKGVGVSRRAQGDSYKQEVALAIAKSRAIKAIE